jgi:hypothetical protein
MIENMVAANDTNGLKSGSLKRPNDLRAADDR